MSDSYVVALDFGGVGYFMSGNVNPVDLRLLDKMPKPISADTIYKQFQGRITREDAEQLQRKVDNSYRQLQSLCEDHAHAISFLSTNAAYREQYTRLISSVVDPSFSDATDRLKNASKTEFAKFKDIMQGAKQTLETQFLDGKDANIFFAQATTVLGKLKTSTEVQQFQANLQQRAKQGLETAKQQLEDEDVGDIRRQRLVLSQVIETVEARMQKHKDKLNDVRVSLADREKLIETLHDHEADLVKARNGMRQLERMASQKLGVESITKLKPLELIEKAEGLLPQLTARAEVFKESGEKYLAQLQQTERGQLLIQQAKQLVQSVDNPEEFCANVHNAISDVQLDKLAQWGNTLTTDRQKRQEFVDRVKDHCLDFFMSVLPTIKVDTISGIEENIEYSMSKLDLSNFRVRKERVKVRMGTVADEELFTVRASHLTALLKGFQWTFSQKNFPYAHGGGLADADLSGGVILLGFKAEKKLVNKETGEYKPTLVLNSMEIEIRRELKIAVQGSWFSAIYNLLTSAFAELIRDYLAKTMETKLLRHMIKLLTTLNTQMDKYWPFVFQLLDIRIDDLPPASPWRGAKELDIQPHEIDYAFSDRLSIPFAFSRGILNRYVVVNRVLDHRTTDQEQNQQKSESSLSGDLLQVPLGGPVVALNGLTCHKLTLEEFKELLDTLPYPLTLRFSLIPEDTSKNRQQRSDSRPQYFNVTYKQPGPFGLRLRNRPLASWGAIVLGFTDIGSDAKGNILKGVAELSGKIQPGQLLIRVNDVDLRFKKLSEILQVLKGLKRRPVTLHFASNPDCIVKLSEWPPMIETEPWDEETADERKYMVVSAFARVPSFAQKSRVVQRGDILWKLNGTVMTAPAQPNFDAIMEKLKEVAEEHIPMHAIFISRDVYVAYTSQRKRSSIESNAHMNKEATSMSPPASATAVVEGDSAEISATKTGNQEQESQRQFYEQNVTDNENCEDDIDIDLQKEVVFPKLPFGIIFGSWKDEAAYIRFFTSSTGPAERCGLINRGQAVLQICGKTVPAEATPASIEQMIQDVDVDSITAAVVRNDDDGQNIPPMSFTLSLRDMEMEREIMK